MKNGKPPTDVTAAMVVITESALIMLRPKLSDSELSIPRLEKLINAHKCIELIEIKML